MEQPKISWIILTWNRLKLVEKSVIANRSSAGYPIHEMIWVDNGSTDGTATFAKNFGPDVLVLNKTNLGVSRGYNRGMVLATGDYLVITGCDMVMPDNWLHKLVECFQKIPKTGVVSMYSIPIEKVPERKRGEPEVVEGIKIQPALPMGRRMWPRKLMKDFGYFREDFHSLYGWEDVHWGYRAEKICKEKGLRFYTLPDEIVHHMDEEEFEGEALEKYKLYKQWKKDEAFKKENIDMMHSLERTGWPYFNPYV